MTDYILITSVTAEKLFGIFEESVRETCAKDYSAVQIDAWIARATPARWQQLLSGDLHFIAAVNQTSGELEGAEKVITFQFSQIGLKIKNSPSPLLWIWRVFLIWRD